MRISIRHHGLELTESDRVLIESSLRHAVARFEDRVLDVTAYLADSNGPRGGLDKECRVVLHLRQAGYIAIEEHDGDLTRLIDRVSDRVGATVARQVKRVHEQKWGRRALPGFSPN